MRRENSSVNEVSGAVHDNLRAARRELSSRYREKRSWKTHFFVNFAKNADFSYVPCWRCFPQCLPLRSPTSGLLQQLGIGACSMAMCPANCTCDGRVGARWRETVHPTSTTSVRVAAVLEWKTGDRRAVAKRPHASLLAVVRAARRIACGTKTSGKSDVAIATGALSLVQRLIGVGDEFLRTQFGVDSHRAQADADADGAAGTGLFVRNG